MFFIMMNNQKRTHIMPIVDRQGEVVLFPTEAEAIECGKENPYAFNFGFEVFEQGTGTNV
jgi:hypothetical protein